MSLLSAVRTSSLYVIKEPVVPDLTKFVRAAKLAFNKMLAELGCETECGDYSGKEPEACRSELRQSCSEFQELIPALLQATHRLGH